MNLKKIFSILVIFLFLSNFSNKIIAQTSQPNTGELILEVTNIDSKNYTEIKNAIASINGVTIAAYCEEFKCFLIYFDTSLVPFESAIPKKLMQLDPSYKLKKKYHVTISEMIKNCTQFPVDPVGEGK